jgi:hypothetical protein
MTSVRRSARRTRAHHPAHLTARFVGVVAGLVTVATAVCVGLLAGGHVDLSAQATARPLGGSTVAAGLAFALVVCP